MVPSKTHVNNAGKSQQKKQRSAGTVKKRAEVRETVQQDVDSELSDMLDESAMAESDLAMEAAFYADVAELGPERSVDTSGAPPGLKTGGRQRKKARKAAMQDTHLRNSDSESSEEGCLHGFGQIRCVNFDARWDYATGQWKDGCAETYLSQKGEGLWRSDGRRRSCWSCTCADDPRLIEDY